MWWIKKILLSIFLLGILISLNNNLILAQTSDCQGKQGQDKINCLQNKINDLQGQKRTLSSQIAVMDSQINLTQARIDATKQEISSLTLDIDTATKKITGLESSLNDLIKVLLNRMVATYEIGRTQPFEILLSSSNATNFFSRLNYLRVAQVHDKQLIYLTQQAKSDYANQKNIFEDKKKRVLALKTQLENYTNQLEQGKRDKQALLIITQNDEATYQQKLQAALAEQQAINAIGAGGGTTTFARKVKEGDVIGSMIDGPSACSSGRHLHLEIHKNNSIQDPSQYLSNRGVTWDNSPDSPFSFTGTWGWPLFDAIYIEQGFGMTFYARVLNYYYGGPHTGIDMDSRNSDNSPNLNVKAVRDGDLYKGSIGCRGGTLLFSRVDQSDGVQTFYLHMVSN